MPCGTVRACLMHEVYSHTTLSRASALRLVRLIGFIGNVLALSRPHDGTLLTSSIVSAPQPAAMEAPYEDSKDEQLSPGGKAAILLQRVCCPSSIFLVSTQRCLLSWLTLFFFVLVPTRRDIKSSSTIPSRTWGRDGLPSQ